MKRVRQNEKRRVRNRQILSTSRTFIKRVRAAVDSGDIAEAQAALPAAVKSLNSAASKGVIHRNQAARKISRLTKAVNGMS